ncbi:MAG TPA: type II toxin-antitoxin system HicA family toxin [Halococcus sp.]|nr:type II toxin-antitoxin system HicA family toxin [Halococcus sp.]
MPPRQFSSRDVLKVLDKAGWQYANPGSGGSHVVMVKRDHAGERYTVTIPMGYDPIRPGTLRSIATQAGAQDFDEFCRWIDENR